MGLVKLPKEQSFWEKDLSYTVVLLTLSRNWFESFIQTIYVVDNLYVVVETKEDNKL